MRIYFLEALFIHLIHVLNTNARSQIHIYEQNIIEILNIIKQQFGSRNDLFT